MVHARQVANTELEELTSRCLSNASKDRPGMSEILHVLQAALEEYDHRIFDVVGPLVGCIMHRFFSDMATLQNLLYRFYYLLHHSLPHAAAPSPPPSTLSACAGGGHVYASVLRGCAWGRMHAWWGSAPADPHFLH